MPKFGAKEREFSPAVPSLFLNSAIATFSP